MTQKSWIVSLLVINETDVFWNIIFKNINGNGIQTRMNRTQTECRIQDHQITSHAHVPSTNLMKRNQSEDETHLIMKQWKWRRNDEFWIEFNHFKAQRKRKKWRGCRISNE